MFTVHKINGKYRVMDDTGHVAMRKGTEKPLDGGGHGSKEKAERQASYLNDWLKKNK